MTAAPASTLPFEHTYANELPELVLSWRPESSPDPRFLVLNERLAADLGLERQTLAEGPGLALFSGGSSPASAVAMAYAGHQFGNYSPRLGDGRALLLGEIVDPDGRRWDLHLKGSGRTPFARGGDGRAELGPMLREYLIAEAMHALRIPTGRALAVVATGETIQRSGPVPGAVLTRVASSHLRIGTFEYALRIADPAEPGGLLARLIDYALARHFPDRVGSENASLALLDSVVEVQASLVAQWMQVGFIHGVMNTDNMTISGETIDYGPCAFLDSYDPATVYSSIDHAGRYAFGNQPGIAHWNLARLAETLLPHIDPVSEAAVEAAMASLDRFAPLFRQRWVGDMRDKLGLSEVDPSQADGLVDRFVAVLQETRADYTSTFRALSATLRTSADVAAPPLQEIFGDAKEVPEAAAWYREWRAVIAEPAVAADRMDAINPLYIPRNHLVDEALRKATDGDMGAFEQLLELVTDPYRPREGRERYAQPAPADFDRSFRTFCGT